MSDNLDMLGETLYERTPKTSEWVGGPNAKILADANDEIERLRAALAEARRPKTCAGCKLFRENDDECNNPRSPTYQLKISSAFGCIHWEPAEPAPGSGQEK